MKTVRLTTAQAVVRYLAAQRLAEEGTEAPFVAGMFGIFGHGNVNGIGQALEAQPGVLRFIQGKNEQGMVHAAVAYAKAMDRRRIWACTSSIGPGALNMVTAAAVATVNRLPVLLLPGDVFSDRLPDPVLQQLESPADGTVSVNDAFRPVSRYWDRITRPSQVMSALDRAMAVLTDPAETGAVTLSLPQDVQTEAYDFPLAWLEPKVRRIPRRGLDPDTLAETVGRIRKARRPVLIVGGGVRYSRAGEALSAFADRFGVPFVETQAGKGVLPHDHPWNLGAVGVTGTRAANRTVARADLVIAVGSRLTDFTTASHTAFAEDAGWIALNVNLGDAIKMGAIPAQADARTALAQWTEALAETGYQTAYDAAEIARQKADWTAEVERLGQAEGEGPVSQAAAVVAINRALTPNDVMIAAAGGLPGDLHRLWRSPGGGTYHLEYGFSCMGYEIAGALGETLARPDRRVFALVGDGSYLLLHSELVTALQEGVSFTVVVFDNHGYQCIEGLAREHGASGRGNAFRFGPDGVGPTGAPIPIDFAENARSLGAVGVRVETVAELLEAIRKSRAEVRPTVIHLPVRPGSGTEAYDAWWRVDVAEVSDDPAVIAARREAMALREDGRRYRGG